MSALLHGVFIEPLMRIYGLLFAALPSALGVGGQIILFGILLNLLLMPLYAQMEQRSRGTRALRAKVAAEEDRMRRHFKGRERYFYIRAVHRQFQYRPLAQVLASADLFVQVIVFFTVFHFLSDLEILKGAAFGPLRDLSQPDRLLGGVNFMPFLMTAINVGAVFAYSQERSRRVQALLLAGLFLVLLYNSPSGLVLYWTTNNLFSLARNLLARRASRSEPGRLGQKFAALRSQQ
jgi:membrane protein insertase Oxa1/YidC/SpoIIIJ